MYQRGGINDDSIVCAIRVITALTLVYIGTAHAEESPPGVFGDWGGIRTFLADHGVDLHADYINELAHNAQGGTDKETADADQFYFGGSLDLQHLLGIPGSRIVFSLTDRNGASLSPKAKLNTLLEVQEIYGEGNYTRLNQLYLQQEFLDRAVILKFGRLTGTFDFMPFSCSFQNITFCATLPSHNVVSNWIAFPGGTWAGLARFQFQRDWYFQGGAYEIDPALQEHGSRFAFGKPFAGSGKRIVAEAGWLPPSAGIGGSYRVGAWRDDVGGPDLYFNDTGTPLATNGGVPLQRHHQSGFYAMAQQRVWEPSIATGQGLSLFINLVQTDRNINAIQQIAEIGLFWTGPLFSRTQDDLGAAIGRVHVNSRIAQSETLYNTDVAEPLNAPLRAVQGAEYPTEVYYSVNVTPAVKIRPNVQFIHAPGGVSGRTDVIVLGLHSSISF
jgi:porin